MLYIHALGPCISRVCVDIFDQASHYLYYAESEMTYCKVSNIRRTVVGNKIVDHSDVVGASPVGAAPTTSSFTT